MIRVPMGPRLLVQHPSQVLAAGSITSSLWVGMRESFAVTAPQDVEWGSAVRGRIIGDANYRGAPAEPYREIIFQHSYFEFGVLLARETLPPASRLRTERRLEVSDLTQNPQKRGPRRGPFDCSNGLFKP